MLYFYLVFTIEFNTCISKKILRFVTIHCSQIISFSLPWTLKLASSVKSVPVRVIAAMNQSTNMLKVISVIFVVQCWALGSQERDSSDLSGCDSDNEVTHEINDIESSVEDADIKSVNRKRYNLLKENAKKGEESTTSKSGKYICNNVGRY